MSEEKKQIIKNFGETFSELPEKEQSYVIGRMTGYKDGFEAGKQEAKKEKT